MGLRPCPSGHGLRQRCANEKPFSFWNCQKDAIETVIYVYEVSKLHRLSDLKRSFNAALPNIEDLWSKYCFKMATGSGKTFVMELAMVWQYFNRLYEPNERRKQTRIRF